MLKKIKYSILESLSYLSDETYLSLLYTIAHRRKLNLKEPQRFSEKIQYYKIHYRNSLMLSLTDKYEVRKYVSEMIGEEYLNELYQICNCANNIDFDILPEKFVIKTTDGGNGDNVLICHNKNILDKNKTIKLIDSWKNKNYSSITREWAYGNSESRIIIERYLESSEDNKDRGLEDYKFLCFNGKCKYFWVDTDRFTEHKRAWFDSQCNFLSNVKNSFPIATNIVLPKNTNKMIELAEKLSSLFPFARVDFYNIKEKIVFGEITFYPGSGFERFSPDSFDYILGKNFVINF